MRWAIALLLLPGCPWCDIDRELDVVGGATAVRAGERVTLTLDSDGYHAGPDRCRGHWYVDGIERGNAEVGTITRCGVYTAPPVGAREVRIEASQYPLGECADCCPSGARTLKIVD